MGKLGGKSLNDLALDDASLKVAEVQRFMEGVFYMARICADPLRSFGKCVKMVSS